MELSELGHCCAVLKCSEVNNQGRENPNRHTENQLNLLMLPIFPLHCHKCFSSLWNWIIHLVEVGLKDPSFIRRDDGQLAQKCLAEFLQVKCDLPMVLYQYFRATESFQLGVFNPSGNLTPEGISCWITTKWITGIRLAIFWTHHPKIWRHCLDTQWLKPKGSAAVCVMQGKKQVLN